MTRLVTTAILACCCACQVFPIGSTIVLQPDECMLTGLGGQGQAVLQAAVQDWQGAGATGLRLGTPGEVLEPGEVGLPIECVPPSQLDSIPNEVCDAEYVELQGKILVSTQAWTPVIKDPRVHYSPSMSKDLIEHEIGHAFGMNHVMDPNAIMYWGVHLYGGFSPQDLADLDCAQHGQECSEVRYDTANH